MDLVLFLKAIVALQKKTPSWTITGPSSCSLESPEKGVSPGGLPRSDGSTSISGGCGRLS